MNQEEIIKNRISNFWELEKIKISHNVIDYNVLGKISSKNETESVRLHFGLKGSYSFKFKELNTQYNLSGHHNNIMYSKGLTLAVENKSSRIETFGINFTTDFFLAIAKNGNEPLQRFAEKVLHKQNCILANEWKTNTFKIQQVINEIIECPYQAGLQDLFLLSKSIELLVLQADLYSENNTVTFIKNSIDKKKIIEAKELLTSKIENPPTIIALSKIIGINEYKLKKGFKELFGTTIFGYIHQNRMILAKKLLLDTPKSAKEIAYEIGYSSPQHFSKSFKTTFGVTPNSIRENPDSIIK